MKKSIADSLHPLPLTRSNQPQTEAQSAVKRMLGKLFLGVFSLQTIVLPTLLPMRDAYAQATPAAGAVAGQKAIMDSAANGVPIANIAPPSAAGVSLNQYNQFNVAPNGLILNNSSANVQTQLGGWIAGNMQLGVTPARIIVNQVISSNPSQLRGPMEVAGRNANVVTANPNGINCDGCSFINTGRASLTTGVPQYGAGGSLVGFDTSQGTINIGAAGLNAINVEQLDLIARGLVVEGEIWARNLNVLAGANQSLYDSLQVAPQSGAGAPPSFAVDIRSVGGMYANQIFLIATDKGLGVNSTGRLSAMQGNLVLNSNGDLSLKDTYAKGSLSLTSTGNTTLTGQTLTDGALTLQAADHLNNSGTVYSGNSLTLNAGQFANTGGSLQALGDISATAQSIQLQGASVATDKRLTLNASTGDLTLSNTSVTAGESIHASASGQLSNTGGNWQSGQDTRIQAASVSNAGSTVLAGGQLQVAALGQLNNTGGKLLGASGVNIQAASLKNDSIGATQARIVSDQSVQISTSDVAGVNNQGGVISAKSDMSVQTGGQTLGNQAGRIVAGGNLTVIAGDVNNQQGQISGDGTLSFSAANLSNRSGLLAAAGSASINATGAVDNTAGAMASTGGALTVTTGQSLSNDSGKLQAAQTLTVTAGATSNTGGLVAGQDVALTVDALNNSTGQIVAARALNLISQAVSNNAGLIQSAGNASINSQGQVITNTNSGSAAGILSGGSLTLQVGSLNNQAGYMASNGNLNMTITGDLDNSKTAAGAGQIISNAAATLNAGNIVNTGSSISAAGNLAATTSGSVNNQSGTLSAGGSATVSGGTGLDNTNGSVSAKTDLSVTAPALVNAGGSIIGDTSVTVTTSSQSPAGAIASAGNVGLTVHGNYSNAGILSAQGNLTVNASNITNSGTLHANSMLTANATGSAASGAGNLTNTGEISGQTTVINANGTVTNSGAGLIDGVNTTINAATVNNTARIFGDTLRINATNVNNDATGVIAARDSLFIATQNLSNTNGALIYANNDIAIGGSLDGAGAITGSAVNLTNRASTIEAGRKLDISALSINNLNGGYTTNTVEIGRQALREYQSDGGGPLHTNFDWFVLGDVAPCNPTGANVYSYMRNGWNPYACGTSAYIAYEKVNPAAWGTRAYADPLDPLTATAADYARWGVTAPAPAQDPTAATTAANDAITAYNLSVENDYGLLGCCHYYDYSYTQVTKETQLASSNPGKLLSGAGMTLQGSTLNDVSQIVAGGSLFIVGPAVDNRGIAGTREIDVMDGLVRLVVPGSGGPWSSFSRAPVVQTFDLAAYTYQQHTNQTAGYTATRSGTTANIGSAAGVGAASFAPTVVTRVTLPGSAGMVLSTLPGLQAPTNSLFTQHREPGARYLVETDPRFTNLRTFLSSDYMLQTLNMDPERTLKRYGDGFFEQKEINDQILALTGRRFLSNYSSTEDEYKALMDAGVAFGKVYQLTPGVSLSAEQMALLTTDIVWLTEQTVTLADGSTQQVLIPLVYLRRIDNVDLQQSGALIAGRDVRIQTTGDITNSGQISADAAAILASGRDITNTGRIRANQVLASAAQDLSNIGGAILGTGIDSSASLLAGRDIRLLTTTQSSGVTGPNGAINTWTGLDRVATVSAANVSSYAGREIILAGASVNADGQIILSAGRDVAIGGVATEQTSQTIFDAKNYSKRSSSQDVGSQLSAGGNIDVTAGRDIALTGSGLQSVAGAISADAGRDISITEGRQTSSDEFARETTKKGFLSSSTTTVRNDQSQDSAIGSSISGVLVSLQSGRDTSIRGSNVVGEQDVNIRATGDVQIVAATNTQQASSFNQELKSGLGAMGGLSYGKREQSTDQQGRTTTAVGSAVGSIGGNVTIHAGESYRQVGSDVLAPAGGITILAKTVDIIEARETSQSSTEQKFKQSGASITVSNPVIDAAMGIKGTADTLQAMGNTSDSRMQALGAAAAALNTYNTVNKVAEVMKDPVKAATSVGFNISIGSSNSQSNSTETSNTARGSSVGAGGNVSITASGAGKDSNILIQGSDVTAGNNARLLADGAVTLQAAQNTVEQHSTNGGSSASIGIGINFGSQSGISLNASASQSRGNADGQDLVQSNTHITAGNTASVTSGGDTTLEGATVTANTVKADVGGNLNIESLQDTSTYTSQQQSSGGGVSLCIPPLCYGTSSVSVSGGKSNIDSNFASVTEQSGIKAGDGGFQVTVKNDTDLKGGAITSTDKAVDEGKNSFTTGGALTTSDIQNKADYKGDGYNINASLGFKAGDQSSGTTPEQVAASKAAPTNSGSAGIGRDSGNASSVTQAAISGIAGNKDARTGDAEVGIQKIFDANKVQKEIDAQIAITAEFGKLASKAVGDFAQVQLLSAQSLRVQANAKAQTDPESAAALNAQAKALEDNWGDSGVLRVAAHTLIGGLTGGAGGAAGAAAGTLTAPAVADALRQAGIDGPLAQTLTALASTAAGTAVGGATGAGTAFNEVVNNFLNHNRPSMLRLSEREKYELAASGCAAGDKAACAQRDELVALSVERDRALAQACSGQTPDYCNDQKSQAIAMGNKVFTTPSGYTYANSLLSTSLNTSTIGPVFDSRMGTFQDAAVRSTAEALLLEAGNQALGAFIGAAISGAGMTSRAVEIFFTSNGVPITDATAARIANNFGREGDRFTLAAEQMVAAKNANWVTSEGKIWWPPGSGNVPGSEFKTVLDTGTKLDRYGGTTPNSSFLAPSGTPLEQRALAPFTNTAVRDEYVVLKPLAVEQSNAMPWFGKQGMGLQFDTRGGIGLPIEELVKQGYLRKVVQ